MSVKYRFRSQVELKPLRNCASSVTPWISLFRRRRAAEHWFTNMGEQWSERLPTWRVEARERRPWRQFSKVAGSTRQGARHHGVGPRPDTLLRLSDAKCQRWHQRVEHVVACGGSRWMRLSTPGSSPRPSDCLLDDGLQCCNHLGRVSGEREVAGVVNQDQALLRSRDLV